MPSGSSFFSESCLSFLRDFCKIVKGIFTVALTTHRFTRLQSTTPSARIESLKIKKNAEDFRSIISILCFSEDEIAIRRE